MNFEEWWSKDGILLDGVCEVAANDAWNAALEGANKEIEQLQKDNKRMFLGGFKISNEGWNGEYPYGDEEASDAEIWQDIKDNYEKLANQHNSIGVDDG